MSDELTSARDAYLSHFSHATDDSSKSVIMKAITDNIQRSLPHGEHRTFARSDDQQSTDKIRFIQEYLRSIGYRPTVVQLDPHTGNGVVRFEPQASTAPAPQTSQSSQAPRRRRQLRDPIADAINGLSQAVTASGENPQWQQNVTQTTEQFTGDIADAVVERIAPTITNAARRTASSSRSRGSTASQAEAAAVLTSGNVVPGSTFQPFQPMGEVPDLNNPPRYIPPAQRPDTIDDYDADEGEPPSVPTSRWAEEARRITEDIANTATATAAAAGGNIPPAPPGNDPPNGPPDPPDDENNDIWRMMLEYLRRLLGVDFGDLANIMSRLTMNATNIIGGNNSMSVPNGPAGHAANLMDTIADYFNVPRETEAATIEAQEHLRRSIDRLTEATDGASGANPAQPQGRFARIRSFFTRRPRSRRGGIATATRIATYMRPVLTRIGNLVPRGIRNTAARFGQNVVGNIAQRYGIPAATAARFGAALGPAAAGLGVALYAIPLIGTAAVAAVKGLMYLSSESMKTTMRLVNYSGLLSHANANLEVNRVLRDFRAAQAIQRGGAARIRLKDQIENEWAPISIAITKIGNDFGRLFDNITLFSLKSAKAIAGIQNEQETAFFEGLRHIMMISRLAVGLPPMPGGAGGQDDPDMRRFAGREAIFGQDAVDMVDFNRRNRGPRRPVNPNGAGR